MPNANFSTGKKIAFTATMFIYINLVLTIFWILKPLKKTLFIQQYDGENPFRLGPFEMLGSGAELLAKHVYCISDSYFPHTGYSLCKKTSSNI